MTNSPSPAPPPSNAQPSQPAYATGYPPAPPRGLSITSMVLGVLGLFLDIFVVGLLSVAAVIFGHLALKKEPAGKGLAVAGLVTGYIGIVIMIGIVIAIFVAVVVPLIFVGVAAGTGS
jgi:hypothetical protein